MNIKKILNNVIIIGCILLISGGCISLCCLCPHAPKGTKAYIKLPTGEEQIVDVKSFGPYEGNALMIITMNKNTIVTDARNVTIIRPGIMRF